MTLSVVELKGRLTQFPRFPLALRPTPLESVPVLGKAVGCSELMLKRDDLTGLAFGGNKTRELDFLIGEALATGCDALIAGGGAAESNHARQCAAAALRAGLEPIIVLRDGDGRESASGNLVITQVLARRLEWVEVGADFDEREAAADAMEAIAREMVTAGRKPYVLRSSFDPLAAVAYVECVIELAEQIDPFRPSTIWVTSMGATHVGLLLGVSILGLPWQVVGATWKPESPGLGLRLAELAEASAAMLGMPSSLLPEDFTTVDCGGPSYAVSSPESRHAFALAADVGVLLDPVYTAKGMAALIRAVRDGRVPTDEPVVFVHTGGLPAIFAFKNELSGSSAQASG